MTKPFFCHGVPGGPGDATLGCPTGATAPNLVPPGAQNPLTHALALFDADGDAPRPVMGFSLGAMTALAIAAARPGMVTDLTLISPAAPLQLGDFLPDMAGRHVFAAAQKRPALFRALMRVQGGLTRIAPNQVLKLLFADAPASDRALLDSPDSRAVILAGLRNAYIARPVGSRAIIRAYTQDWSDVLTRISCPVTIWQGDADTWTPPKMADALANALPGPVTRQTVPDAGHFATLVAYGHQPHQPQPTPQNTDGTVTR